MHLKKIIIFICLFTAACTKANSCIYAIKTLNFSDTTGFQVHEIRIEKKVLLNIEEKRPNPILILFKKKQSKNKKIIAATLAFPFPFGIVGLHRIYLGCAPYIPVVYIGSLGGIFGFLPLLDFFVLISNKDIERFENNNNVFMWVD